MPADKENFVELLAPARDCGVAREAILAGADAVYIGASDFGARAAAANRLDDISQLCKFAHVFGCKVYVALNTILTDAELPARRRSSPKALRNRRGRLNRAGYGTGLPSGALFAYAASC